MSTPALGLACPEKEKRGLICEDGSVLEYFIAGSTGPYLVCVNALGQDLLVFSRLAEHFARTHRVIAWKPRGTFEPGRPVATLWDQVADLERITRQEAIRECSLITWCSGAKVALEFARRVPVVRSMVLTNGTYKTLPLLAHLETEFEQTLLELCKAVVKSPALAPMMMESIQRLLTGAAPRRAAAWPEAPSAGTADRALRALIVEPFQSPETTLRYAQQVVNYLSYDITPALRAFEQPVLVLAGECDRVSSPAMSRAVAEQLPCGRFAEVASGSHYCLYENAPEALSLIEDFIRNPRMLST